MNSERTREFITRYELSITRQYLTQKHRFDFQSIACRMLVFGFLVVLAFSAVVALVVLIAIAGNGSHHDHDNHHHH